MATIIKNNNTYTSASQLKTADVTGRNQLQPIDTDWVKMNPAQFAIVDTFTLSFSQNALGRFSVGDRIRIKGTGNTDYEYMTVGAVGTGFIYIVDSESLSGVSGSIQEISVSKFWEATGFPYQLQTTGIFSGNDTLDIEPDFTAINYRQYGREIYIEYIEVGFYINSGSGSKIYLSLDFITNLFDSGLIQLYVFPQIVDIIPPSGTRIRANVSGFTSDASGSLSFSGTFSEVGAHNVQVPVKLVIAPSAGV